MEPSEMHHKNINTRKVNGLKTGFDKDLEMAKDG